MLLQAVITYPVADVLRALVDMLLHQFPNGTFSGLTPRPAAVHAHDDDPMGIAVVGFGVRHGACCAESSTIFGSLCHFALDSAT